MDPMAYNLLKQGGDPKVAGMDDGDWFLQVKAGLAKVDFADSDQEQTWKALAAVYSARFEEDCAAPRLPFDPTIGGSETRPYM
jgi:hypothetical protein